MARKGLMIDASWFEHLLNCMANQKFIVELSEVARAEAQAVINEAWLEGMAILHDNTIIGGIIYPVQYGMVSFAHDLNDLREKIKSKPDSMKNFKEITDE